MSVSYVVPRARARYNVVIVTPYRMGARVPPTERVTQPIGGHVVYAFRSYYTRRLSPVTREVLFDNTRTRTTHNLIPYTTARVTRCRGNHETRKHRGPDVCVVMYARKALREAAAGVGGFPRVRSRYTNVIGAGNATGHRCPVIKKTRQLIFDVTTTTTVRTSRTSHANTRTV